MTSALIDSRFSMSKRLLSLFIILLAAVVAWRIRWIQDDAFIVFEYAQSWAEGRGLTWFGDRVDGFANPLWVAMISLGMVAGVDPIPLSQVVGVIALIGTLLLSLHVFRSIFRSDATSLFALGMMTVNYSFLAYGTGGLETMVATLWMTGAIAWTNAVLQRPSYSTPFRLNVLSAYLAMGAMIRYDLVVVSVASLALVIARLSREARPRGASIQAIAQPFVGILLSYAAVRWSYYDSALPNLFHAKAMNGSAMNGALYLTRYFSAYWLWIFVVVGIWATLRPSRLRAMIVSENARLSPAVVLTASWLLYVVVVGGDFMEFRLIVPATPGIAFVCALGISYIGSFVGHAGVRIALCVLATLIPISGSIHHASTFRGMTDDKTLDSVEALRTFYGLYPDENWSAVGTPLGKELGDKGVIVALSACGAIPYYSRVNSVDMCGLNDRFVARHGIRASDSYRRPGHRLAASREYLRTRGVNLIIGHPTVVPRGMLESQVDLRYWYEIISQMAFLDTEYIGNAQLVSMPIDANRSLIMWYFKPHPTIDAKLATREWEQRSVWPGF